MINKESFSWNLFLQPYEIAVAGFILKMEGIKKQYNLYGMNCPIEIVSGRIKTPESILDKAKRMGIEFEEIDEKVYDIGGIRITCKYIEDVYKVRDLLLARKDITLREERDYIKNQKPSGYRSLHLIVTYNVETIFGQVPVILEFQIRTHAMHFWASIEHQLKYKFKKQIPNNLKERLKAASLAAEKLDEEMSSIHNAILELDQEHQTEERDNLETELTMKDIIKL